VVNGNSILKSWTTLVVLLFFWPMLIGQSMAAGLGKHRAGPSDAFVL
jgi:hypothetical protein